MLGRGAQKRRRENFSTFAGKKITQSSRFAFHINLLLQWSHGARKFSKLGGYVGVSSILSKAAKMCPKTSKPQRKAAKGQKLF